MVKKKLRCGFWRKTSWIGFYSEKEIFRPAPMGRNGKRSTICVKQADH